MLERIRKATDAVLEIARSGASVHDAVDSIRARFDLGHDSAITVECMVEAALLVVKPTKPVGPSLADLDARATRADIVVGVALSALEWYRHKPWNTAISPDVACEIAWCNFPELTEQDRADILSAVRSAVLPRCINCQRTIVEGRDCACVEEEQSVDALAWLEQLEPIE